MLGERKGGGKDEKEGGRAGGREGEGGGGGREGEVGREGKGRKGERDSEEGRESRDRAAAGGGEGGRISNWYGGVEEEGCAGAGWRGGGSAHGTGDRDTIMYLYYIIILYYKIYITHNEIAHDTGDRDTMVTYISKPT